MAEVKRYTKEEVEKLLEDKGATIVWDDKERLELLIETLALMPLPDAKAAMEECVFVLWNKFGDQTLAFYVSKEKLQCRNLIFADTTHTRLDKEGHRQLLMLTILHEIGHFFVGPDDEKAHKYAESVLPIKEED